MHPTDKRNQFIELRSQGWSIHKIARTIDVPKSTLADWQKQEQPRIDELKQMADEAREEEMLETMQRDHEKVSARLALVEQQLDEQLRAKVGSLSLMELCRLSSTLRSQLSKSNTGHFRTKPDASTAPDVREVPPESKTEQNGLPSLASAAEGTTSAQNRTPFAKDDSPSAFSKPSTQNPLDSQPLPEHFRTKPDAPEASDIREPSPETKTDQNGLPSLASAAEGTTSTENGTPFASKESPAAFTKPPTQDPFNHQLPPKPPAPPERMIGHKIDPSKIVGRKTFASAS